MLLGYGAKVGLGNMRVKAENRMVTNEQTQNESKNQSNGHHKVFEDGEGDYVDFEELPK